MSDSLLEITEKLKNKASYNIANSFTKLNKSLVNTISQIQKINNDFICRIKGKIAIKDHLFIEEIMESLEKEGYHEGNNAHTMLNDWKDELKSNVCHDFYVPSDFTIEEINDDNETAIAVIECGLSICKCCREAEGGLSKWCPAKVGEENKNMDQLCIE